MKSETYISYSVKYKVGEYVKKWENRVQVFWAQVFKLSLLREQQFRRAGNKLELSPTIEKKIWMQRSLEKERGILEEISRQLRHYKKNLTTKTWGFIFSLMVSINYRERVEACHKNFQKS